jgi:hypothetical protein
MVKTLRRELDAWIATLEEAPRSSADAYQPNVEIAYRRLKAEMGENTDVLIRRIRVPSCAEPVVVAYVDGMADTQMVDQDIVGPLLATQDPPEQWSETTLRPVHISQEKTWPKILEDLVEGNTLLFAPRLPFVWVIDTVKYPARAIERPQTEKAVRGPEEAFNEVLLTQKNQLRRVLKTPKLQFRDVNIGYTQNLTASVAYLAGVTNPALIDTAIARLEAVKIDGTANATTIAGLIRDHPWSVFPTIRMTERVDIAVWRLLEGQIVILVDGDPSATLCTTPIREPNPPSNRTESVSVCQSAERSPPGERPAAGGDARRGLGVGGLRPRMRRAPRERRARGGEIQAVMNDKAVGAQHHALDEAAEQRLLFRPGGAEEQRPPMLAGPQKVTKRVDLLGGGRLLGGQGVQLGAQRLAARLGFPQFLRQRGLPIQAGRRVHQVALQAGQPRGAQPLRLFGAPAEVLGTQACLKQRLLGDAAGVRDKRRLVHREQGGAHGRQHRRFDLAAAVGGLARAR